MEGGVQITVIATGFDEIGSRRAVNRAVSTGVDTPVDLKNYSNLKQDETAASAEILANGNGGIAISRRRLIELPLSGDTTESGSSLDPVVDLEMNEDQELEDVPVFMRRHAE